MLIQFKVENYRSFKSEQTFRMPIKKNAVAIYGANSSGKSNFYKALQFLSDFVADSASVNDDDDSVDYQPYFDGKRNPTKFDIEFIQLDIHYRYMLVVSDIVISERLVEINKRESIIFDRRLEDEKDRRSEYAWKFGKEFTGNKKVIKDCIRRNCSVVSLGAMMRYEKMHHIYDWFKKLWCADTFDLKTAIRYVGQENAKERILPILQASGLGIKDFGVYQIENTKELSPKDSSRLSKLVHINMFDKPAIVGVVIENDNGRCDDLDYYGSSGAKKMFVLAVLISNALANGQVLFIDEMDSGLHPNLASKILEMFDDPKKNPKGSQLIFTTHNTNHLERMDQDQVWLVEKKYDHSSELFPLSDFIIRHNENVMQSYLLGNYGGCP